MTRDPKEVFGKPTQFSLSHGYQGHAAPGKEPQGVSETLLQSTSFRTWHMADDWYL